MTRTALTGAALLLGLLALRLWQPAYDALLNGDPPQISRAEVMRLGVAAAQAEGLPADGWNFGVELIQQRKTRLAKSLRHSELLEDFPGTLMRAGGVRRGGQERVLAEFGPKGRLYRLEVLKPTPGTRERDANRPDLADALLARQAGAKAHLYRKVIDGAPTQRGFRTVWERPDLEHPALLARLEIIQRRGALVALSHNCEIADSYLETQYGSRLRWREWFVSWVAIYFWVVFLLGAWSFLSSFVRRSDHLKLVLVGAGIGGLFLAIRLAAGDVAGSVYLRAAGGQDSLVKSWVEVLILDVLLMLGTGLLLASGYAILPRTQWRFWQGAKLMSEGRLLARSVAREVAGGLAMGGLLAAALLVPRVLGFTTEHVDQRFHITPLSAVPAALSLDAARYWMPLAPVALLLPWCLRFRRLRWPLGVMLVLASVGGWQSIAFVYQASWWCSLALALTCMTLSILAYRTWGVLAAWIMPASAMTLYTTGVQMRLPDTSLQEAGITGWFLWLGLLAVSTLVGWRGEEVPEEEVMDSIAASAERGARSERERLRADFDIARHAQQDMLPTESPKVPGYSLSGSCHPALEVGGDLFDYLTFPSGELGLCVADVSGKGVSAALYMTMTKGMLTAACEEPADLRVILTRLNRHLKTAGRRRTFVTMSFALLQPESGRVIHARAGHNPPLLLKGGQSAYRKPSGLGLGLAGDALFQHGLGVEEIMLEPGDSLILYSDGLTECMNAKHELYGEERLARCASECAGRPAVEIETAILEDVREFQGKAPAHDDLTILVIRREPEAQFKVA